MIDAARERLAPFGERVEYVVADLGRPLPLSEPVDAILSTATLHWVPDHDALFWNLGAVLRPGPGREPSGSRPTRYSPYRVPHE